MQVSSQVLDRIAVTFDDCHAVAAAGLILPATVSGKLGLEDAADELVGVGHRPGRKVATVVHAMLAGADCIDDVDILRAGATGRIVGHGGGRPLDGGHVAAAVHLRARPPEYRRKPERRSPSRTHGPS